MEKKEKIIILISSSIMIMLAIFHIFFPFYGDQAFFNLGAKTIANGELLYKDFWDIKQPGIFYFFYLGGRIFSFSEVGIHLFEIIYWLIFSIVIVRISLSMQLFSNRISNYLLPLFTVGVYFALAGSFDRTQVEILVSAPIILVIFIFYKYSKSNLIFPYFISGVLISLVLLFKLILLPVVGCLILYQLYVLIKNKTSFSAILLKKALPVLSGFSILPAVFIAYIYTKGIEGIVYDTFFTLPVQLKSLPVLTDSYTLSKGLARYLNITFPLGVLSIIVIIKELRKRTEFVYMLIVFLLSGIIVIYLHYFKWYYYFQLLLFPMGILSLIFLDRLAEYNIYKQKVAIISMVALVLFILLFNFNYLTIFSYDFIFLPLSLVIILMIYHSKIMNTKWLLLVAILLLFSKIIGKFLILSYTFIININLSGGISDGYKNYYNEDYILLKNESEFLANDKSNYKIYVCGDPLIYYFTNRMQAVPLGGWALEVFMDEQWEKFKEEIIKNRPLYVYIDFDYYYLLETKNKLEVIELNYTNVKSCDNGNWFKLKTP